MIWFGDCLGALATPPIGRSRRVSSNEQPNWNDGNFDFSRINPGTTLELPLLEGPGVVNHIWLTSHAGLMEDLNSLSLRITYDGRPAPGVEAPLGAFFAVSSSHLAEVKSLPISVSSSGSLTSFWRMPFARSCRITVRNDHPTRSVGLYWQVDYVSLPSLPADTMYFHAAYRQEYPAVSGRDYLIFEGSGAGRYVGTTLEVTQAQDGWFGEGDDYFYVDGEEVPSLQGTGTEDYFNDAWGFRQRTELCFGQPYVEGYGAGDTSICYRWHVLDPVVYQKSLKVTIEHKGNAPEGTDFWYLERPDFFSSVAFWYQAGEPAPFGGIPSWEERRVPWQSTLLLTVLRKVKVEGGPTPRVDLHGLFGMRPSVRWADPAEGARMSFPFSITTSGRHAVRVQANAGPGMGEFDLLVDGAAKAPACDLRSAAEGSRTVVAGEYDLRAGAHEICFRSRGRGSLLVESVRALPLPPKVAPQTRRPGYEGNFVRNAIGRAVYAYKLVEGSLPVSLRSLVDAGLLEEAGLRDENGNELRSGLRGGRFTADGPAWSGAWEGIDARR